MRTLNGRRITVVVAEDHASIRENLRYIVNAERDMICVGVAQTGREAIRVTVEKHPDLLLLDADLRDLDGMEVGIRLRRLAPSVRTILYGGDPLAPGHGLGAFVAKGAPVDELLATVRRAAYAAQTQPEH